MSRLKWIATKEHYLLDTHALIFWSIKEDISADLVQFWDDQDQRGNLLVSSISFWEIALLVKKGKLQLSNIHEWKEEILKNTHVLSWLIQIQLK